MEVEELHLLIKTHLCSGLISVRSFSSPLSARRTGQGHVRAPPPRQSLASPPGSTHRIQQQMQTQWQWCKKQLEKQRKAQTESICLLQGCAVWHYLFYVCSFYLSNARYISDIGKCISSSICLYQWNYNW